ncbi:hypothetical protein [Enterovirga rhinocerotis]|uniref:Uncharacterized protein n=1 Tax=Enterovirga rhinocerotis TaxID=1339210 RepID=A0A4R7BWV7_9HYPH|nr:hypothetical protein [Enterovirga rhinocerotis]TDR90061.1 hypothetical protein EV668_2900 [Enterovirga rhinocerotis]
MHHLKVDIARMYREREELFLRRWEFAPADYRQRLSDLNARIRGYEILLCERFPASLRSIFPPTEASAD